MADTLEVGEDGRGTLEDQPPHWRATREVEAITLEVGVAVEEEGYQPSTSRATRGVAETLEDGAQLRAYRNGSPAAFRPRRKKDEESGGGMKEAPGGGAL